MKTFNDATGRVWTLAINVDAIKRVKSLVSVDLLDAVNGKLLEKLVSDPILLCDVLYSLCKPQADASGVSDSDFGRSMAGDVIDLATQAFMEELVDFFPSRRRTVLQKALAKLKNLEAKVLTAAEAKMDSPEIDAVIEKMLADSGAFSIASEALSASPPAP